MKKYFIILCFLSPLLLLAQKRVDLDKFNIKVQIRSLPTMPLDSTYRTYQVLVQSSLAMSKFALPEDPANSVLLEGWRKLSNNAHIKIAIKLEDILPESVTVEEKKTDIKNKQGAIIGTNSVYFQKVVYSFAATARITDYKGTHIRDEVLADRRNKMIYTSPEFANRAVAQGYFLLNSIPVTKELYQKSVNRAMHYLSSQITEQFGFEEVTVNDYMWVVGSRKHPEYDDHRKAFRLMSEVLFSMNGHTPIDGARQQLKPAIDYFEKIKNNYPTSKKHDRKIRYASYFNLTVLYYYLDDPDAMMKEANGLILNDYQTSVGKSFQSTALRLKNQFQRCNINTRHFTIDINSFEGPAIDGNNVGTTL